MAQEFKPVHDTARNVWVVDYQPVDSETGEPIGRPQHFEDATLEGLVSKSVSGHANATVEMHRERKRRKLGDLIDLDPTTPLHNFEGQALSADEMSDLAKKLNTPATMTAAFRRLIEAEFGAPVSVIRSKLQYAEVRERADIADQEIEVFLSEHPDYYICEPNKRDMLKWLEKKNLSITRKNLSAAYEDLRDDLVQRPRPSNASSNTAPAGNSGDPSVSSAANSEPLSNTDNLGRTTTANPGNPSETAAERRTNAVASSGLGRANGGGILPANAATPGSPEALELTLEEVSRLSAAEYAERMRDPKFLAAIDKLHSRK